MFAYVLLAALVNAYAAGNLRDGSELLEVGLFALFAIAGELLFLWVDRRRLSEGLELDPPAELLECEGPHSVTRFRCNGELVEVETCSPVGTSLADHLAQHTADVLAHAAELGCG